jgi:CRP-like cAMP-binding protein
MPSPTPDELAEVELFSGLSELERQVIAKWMDVEEYRPGQRLTEQGAAGYAFFVLRTGDLEVSVDGSTVRHLAPGDYFGEISIIREGRRTATVTATSPVIVWSMMGTRFRELQRDEPEVAATLEKVATRRLAAD